MRRKPRSFAMTLTAFVAAAGAVLAGCSSGPSGDAISWTDGVCSAMLKFTTVATTQPNVDQNDLGKTVTGLRDWLSNTSTAVQSSLDDLRKLGKSPVDGGDAVVSKLDSTLTSIKTSFDDAKNKLTNVDADNPAAASSALTSAATALQGLASLDTTSLNSNPALNEAAAQAPACKQLNSTTSG